MDKQLVDLYQVFQEYPEISIDSRRVQEGSIFFALKGPNFDGNKYAQSALDKGAAFTVVDDPQYHIEGKSMVVKDVLTTLQKLSSYHRSLLKIPVIGITGSNGKTTSKELIKCVLSTKYKVTATEGNYNNHIGVPLSILRINNESQIAIIEMGSNGHGEIEFLCSLAKPDFGLITSIGKAHLEGFGDLDGVIAEKTSLYRSVSNCDGTIIYNTDSKYLKHHLPQNTHNIGYSINGSEILELELKSSFPSIRGICKRGLTQIELVSGMYGEYNVSNIMSALTIGDLFDIQLSACVNAINHYNPTNNRSEVRHFRGASFFLDAYNANPSSVALVIDQFTKSLGSKVIVLGDMLEIGEDTDAEHSLILSSIESKHFEKVILFGELYGKHKTQFSEFEFFIDFEELKSYFGTLDLQGRSVLLKGSRGMKLERLIT